MRQQFSLTGRNVLAQHHNSRHFFAPDTVRHAERNGFRNGGVRPQNLTDLSRCNLFAATDDELFDSREEVR